MNKREFLKLAPIVPIAAVGMLKTLEAEALPVDVSKRYVFRVGSGLTLQDFESLSKKIKSAGFGDVLVVSGDVQIYELVTQANA